jgi:signal transduction histidine kinase
MEPLKDLFSSGGFMPHGFCYMWNPRLVLLHVLSDGLIALAYFSISVTLIYFIRRRRDIPFNWMFVCFGLFIFSCGATHGMEVWTLWHATYWLSGAVKAVTVLASVPTAFLLVQLVPHALALPSPEALRQEINQRTIAQKALDDAKIQLELRVEQRTSELQKANDDLMSEAQRRKGAEEELHSLAGRLITVQEDERKRIARELHDDLSQRLALLCIDLDLLRANLPVGSEAAQELARMRAESDQLVLDMRQISHHQHHPQLALGLKHGAVSFCREFGKQHGIVVELTDAGDLKRIPELISVTLFRVLQEALTNVVKHSGADRATVAFGVEDDNVRMHVRDRGRGFEMANVQSYHGLGLISMRERLRLVRGSLTVSSSPSRGTDVEVVIPIPAPEGTASAPA